METTEAKTKKKKKRQRRRRERRGKKASVTCGTTANGLGYVSLEY